MIIVSNGPAGFMIGGDAEFCYLPEKILEAHCHLRDFLAKYDQAELACDFNDMAVRHLVTRAARERGFRVHDLKGLEPCSESESWH